MKNQSENTGHIRRLINFTGTVKFRFVNDK